MNYSTVRATRALIICASVGTSLCCLFPTPANAAVTSANYEVTLFATLEKPGTLAFSPAGDLYVGNDMPSWTPGQVYVITPDGEMSRLGDPIVDPDVVCFDTFGTISGVAGSVLVGCGTGSPANGHVYAVSPEGLITTALQDFGCNNPGEMKFDPYGRFVISDLDNTTAHDTGRLIAYDPASQTFTTLATLNSGVGSLAIDDDGRIYAGCHDGSVRLYASDGTLLNDGVATGFDAIPSPELGPGGVFGADLYISGSSTIWRYDAEGNRTEIASGFSDRIYDIAFGPDAALYCADFEGYIYRITSLPGDLNIDGAVNAGDLDIVRALWGSTVEPGPRNGDPSGDGLVGSLDLDIVRTNWGTATAASVPEPSVMAMVLGLVIALAAGRRHGEKPYAGS